MERARAAAALLCLAACFAHTAAAPVNEQTGLDLYDNNGAKDGCYYNFQHYGEGDRIMTNEPCLNCTCHNRMLMCYLRVCPFTKPIGQDCTVEKRGDQCCPVITCPDVHVDLLTSTSTTSPAEYGSSDVGHLDKYGCSIGGKFFSEGSKVPPNPSKPCELCYCIRNMTACVMQECTLHVDGCTPVYQKDVCCPVRYSCDHPEEEIPMLDDMTTTVRPTEGFLLTTTATPDVTQDCIHLEQVFADGALIKTEKACEHCYCMKGDIVCVVQECGMPMENEGKNCTSLPPREGQCCPDTYICEGDTIIEDTTDENGLQTTPISTYETVSSERTEGSAEAIPTVTTQSPLDEEEGSGYESTTSHKNVEEGLDDEINTSPVKTLTTTTPSIEDEIYKNPETTLEYEVNMTTDKKIVQEKPASEEPISTISPEQEKPTPNPINQITEYSKEQLPIEESSPVDEQHTVTEVGSTIPDQSQETITQSPIYPTSQKESAPKLDEQPSEIEQPSHVPDFHNTNQETEKTPLSTTVNEETPEIYTEKVTTETTVPSNDKNKEQTTPKEEHNILLTTQSPIEKSTDIADKFGEEPQATQKYNDDSDRPEIPFTQEPMETETAQTTDTPTKKPDQFATEYISTESINEQTTPILYNDSENQSSTPEKTTQSSKPDPSTPESPVDIDITTVNNFEQIEEFTKEQQVTNGIENITPSSISPSTSVESAPELEEKPLTTVSSVTKYQETPTTLTYSEEQQTTSPSDSGIRSETTISFVETQTEKSSTEKDLESLGASKTDSTSTFKPTEAINMEETKTTLVPEKSSYTEQTTSSTINSQDETILPQVNTSPVMAEQDEQTTKMYEFSETTPTNNLEEVPETTTTNAPREKPKLEPELEYKLTTESSTEEIGLISTSSATDIEEKISTTTSYGTTSADIMKVTTEVISTLPEESTSTSVPDQSENEIEEEEAGHILPHIPGEGDCLVDGVTYSNDSSIPSINKCQTSCKCVSSIVKCDTIQCSPPSEDMTNCQPIHGATESCCPTYICDHPKKTTAPESHNQVLESSTLLPSKEEKLTTQKITETPAEECKFENCGAAEEQIVPVQVSQLCSSGSCPTVDDNIPNRAADGLTSSEQNKEELPEIPVVIGEQCTEQSCEPTRMNSEAPKPTSESATKSSVQSCIGESCNVAQGTTEQQSGICIGENCKNIDTMLSPSTCDGDKCQTIPGESQSETPTNILCESGQCEDYTKSPTQSDESSSIPETQPSMAETQTGVPELPTDVICQGINCEQVPQAPTTPKVPSLPCDGDNCNKNTQQPFDHLTEAPKEPELPTIASESATDLPESPIIAPESTTGQPESPTRSPESGPSMSQSPISEQESATGLPESPTNLPESATDLPESSTDLSESPISVPDSAGGQPESPTSSSEYVTGLPVFPTSAPESETRLPEYPTGAPESTSHRPEPSTGESKPETDLPKSPSIESRPSTDLPESLNNAPESETDLPELPASAPGSVTDIPDTPTSVPESAPHLEDSSTSEPKLETDLSESPPSEPMPTTDFSELLTNAPESGTGLSELPEISPESATDKLDSSTNTPEKTSHLPESTANEVELATNEPESPNSESKSTTSKTESSTSASEPVTGLPESSTSVPKYETGEPEFQTSTLESTTSPPESPTSAPEFSTGAPEYPTSSPESETALPESHTSAIESATGLPVYPTNVPGSSSEIPQSTYAPESSSALPESPIPESATDLPNSLANSPESGTGPTSDLDSSTDLPEFESKTKLPEVFETSSLPTNIPKFPVITPDSFTEIPCEGDQCKLVTQQPEALSTSFATSITPESSTSFPEYSNGTPEAPETPESVPKTQTSLPESITGVPEKSVENQFSTELPETPGKMPEFVSILPETQTIVPVATCEEDICEQSPAVPSLPEVNSNLPCEGDKCDKDKPQTSEDSSSSSPVIPESSTTISDSQISIEGPTDESCEDDKCDKQPQTVGDVTKPLIESQASCQGNQCEQSYQTSKTPEIDYTVPEISELPTEAPSLSETDTKYHCKGDECDQKPHTPDDFAQNSVNSNVPDPSVNQLPCEGNECKLAAQIPIKPEIVMSLPCDGNNCQKTPQPTTEDFTQLSSIPEQPILSEGATSAPKDTANATESATDLPAASTSSTEFATRIPEFSTRYPESETGVPEYSTLVPTSKTIPESSTNIPESSATSAPEAPLSMPESSPKISEVTTSVPQNQETSSTAGEPEVPESESESTDSAPEISTNTPISSNALPESPYITPESPNTTPQSTSGKTEAPTYLPEFENGIQEVQTIAPEPATGKPESPTSTSESATDSQSLPESTTGLPESPSSSHESTTGVPGSPSSAPELSATSMSESPTNEPESATDLPQSPTSSPESGPGLVESSSSSPESATTLPESPTTVAKSETGLPESLASVPESVTGPSDLPEPETGVPELPSDNDLSEPVTNAPESATNLPETASEIIFEPTRDKPEVPFTANETILGMPCEGKHCAQDAQSPSVPEFSSSFPCEKEECATISPQISEDITNKTPSFDQSICQGSECKLASETPADFSEQPIHSEASTNIPEAPIGILGETTIISEATTSLPEESCKGDACGQVPHYPSSPEVLPSVPCEGASCDQTGSQFPEGTPHSECKGSSCAPSSSELPTASSCEGEKCDQVPNVIVPVLPVVLCDGLPCSTSSESSMPQIPCEGNQCLIVNTSSTVDEDCKSGECKPAEIPETPIQSSCTGDLCSTVPLKPCTDAECEDQRPTSQSVENVTSNDAVTAGGLDHTIEDNTRQTATSGEFSNKKPEITSQPTMSFESTTSYNIEKHTQPEDSNEIPAHSTENNEPEFMKDDVRTTTPTEQKTDFEQSTPQEPTVQTLEMDITTHNVDKELKPLMTASHTIETKPEVPETIPVIISQEVLPMGDETATESLSPINLSTPREESAKPTAITDRPLTEDKFPTIASLSPTYSTEINELLDFSTTKEPEMLPEGPTKRVMTTLVESATIVAETTTPSIDSIRDSELNERFSSTDKERPQESVTKPSHKPETIHNEIVETSQVTTVSTSIEPVSTPSEEKSTILPTKDDGSKKPEQTTESFSEPQSDEKLGKPEIAVTPDILPSLLPEKQTMAPTLVETTEHSDLGDNTIALEESTSKTTEEQHLTTVFDNKIDSGKEVTTTSEIKDDRLPSLTTEVSHETIGYNEITTQLPIISTEKSVEIEEDKRQTTMITDKELSQTSTASYNPYSPSQTPTEYTTTITSITIQPEIEKKPTVSLKPAEEEQHETVPITNAPSLPEDEIIEQQHTTITDETKASTPSTATEQSSEMTDKFNDNKSETIPTSLPTEHEDQKPVSGENLPPISSESGDFPSPGEDAEHQSPEQFPAPGYGEPDYEEEDQAFGPGTCRYGGKVYVSAQQIPRDDPCDFCFCFRSDIICLQQSCPPPIHGCHEEPISGFCCPRYECHVSMATTLNVTTTTTTTTTTLPPHFLPHAYKGAAQRRGCHIKGHTYAVGEVVRSSSGPCLHCTCGGDGQMKCDPKVCTPEPMLRQMIAAAVSTKRRR